MSGSDLNLFVKRLLSIVPDIRDEFIKAQKNELTRGTISLPQMTVLEHLYRRKICIMSDIARLLSVSMSAATGLVDRMIENRLLQRSRSRSDRRIVNISVTARGKRVARRLIMQQHKMVKRVFGKINAVDRKRYLNIIEKIHKKLFNEKLKK